MKPSFPIYDLADRLYRTGDREWEEGAVHQLLKQCERGRVLLMLELGTLHFGATLAVKHEFVVVSKPAWLADRIRKNSVVRFRVPDDPAQEISLEVQVPHLQLLNGNVAFLCKRPRTFAAARRRTMRFSTEHIDNLRLVPGAAAGDCRIVDLSTGGARVRVDEGSIPACLPLHARLEDVTLRVGRRDLPLPAVIPRVYGLRSAGVEFALPEGSEARRTIDRMVRRIESRERRRIQVPAP